MSGPRAARSGPRAISERPRAAKRAFGAMLGPSCDISELSWAQKCVVFLAFFNTFGNIMFLPQHCFRRHLGAPFAPTWVVERGQEGPKSGQGILKRSARAPLSGPSRTPERPRATQQWPKSGPRAAKSDPRATKSDPRAAKRGARASKNRENGLQGGQDGPKTPPDPPKGAPRLPGSTPGPSQMRPQRLQDDSKRAERRRPTLLHRTRDKRSNVHYANTSGS